MKRWRVVESLAAAMISSGIGLASSATKGSVDPCALVSAAEVEQVMITAVGGAARFGSGRIAGCTFRYAGGRIRVISGVPGAEWVGEEIDRMQRGVRIGAYRENGGIGERAFLLERRGVAVLCLFEGKYYVQVSVEGQHEAAVLEKLARIALARARSGTTTFPQ